MRVNEKENYVRAWNEHIDQLYTLAFNPSEELSAAVQKHIKELKELVPAIADSKIRASKISGLHTGNKRGAV